MQEPQSKAGKLYVQFCKTLRESPYLTEIKSFDDKLGEEEIHGSNLAPAITVDNSSPESGWSSEDQHGFVAEYLVTVTVPNRNPMLVLDLGEKVVNTFFPNDDQDQRALVDRLRTVVPSEFKLSRFPAFFDYDPDSDTTSTEIGFAILIYFDTRGC